MAHMDGLRHSSERHEPHHRLLAVLGPRPSDLGQLVRTQRASRRLARRERRRLVLAKHRVVSTLPRSSPRLRARSRPCSRGRDAASHVPIQPGAVRTERHHLCAQNPAASSEETLSRECAQDQHVLGPLGWMVSSNTIFPPVYCPFRRVSVLLVSRQDRLSRDVENPI